MLGAAQQGCALTVDQRFCPDCGEVFPNTDVWLDARDEVMAEWI